MYRHDTRSRKYPVLLGDSECRMGCSGISARHWGGSEGVSSQRSPNELGFELDDFCLDQPFSQQVENRIECFQRLHESCVLKNEDKEFTKRVLFVGQCDTRNVIDVIDVNVIRN